MGYYFWNESPTGSKNKGEKTATSSTPWAQFVGGNTGYPAPDPNWDAATKLQYLSQLRFSNNPIGTSELQSLAQYLGVADQAAGIISGASVYNPTTGSLNPATSENISGLFPSAATTGTTSDDTYSAYLQSLMNTPDYTQQTNLDWPMALQEQQQGATAAQNAAQNTWQSGENAANMSWQTGERKGTQQWTTGENALDRTSTEKMPWIQSQANIVENWAADPYKYFAQLGLGTPSSVAQLSGGKLTPGQEFSSTALSTPSPQWVGKLLPSEVQQISGALNTMGVNPDDWWSNYEKMIPGAGSRGVYTWGK